MNSDKCYCGRALHYTDTKTQTQVEEVIKKFGPNIVIKLDNNKRFLVPRHYIALHGIKNKDLNKLGFQEVTV